MFTRDFAEAARQQAKMAEGRQQNVRLFTEMFLSLGPDAIKVVGSSHDSELQEARALAADRWSRLLDLEQQIQSDAAKLQARPKQRPSERNDEVLPDRTLQQRNKDWEQQTEDRAIALALLREQAKRERAELEAFTKPRKSDWERE